MEEYKQELELNPSAYICGWLVCIEGINKGRAYDIKPGKNFIGSDPNMDIYIKGDEGIVAKNHAVLLYDEKNRETILLAGSSYGMVYVDEDSIYESQSLINGDYIELGDTKLCFIEFCGKKRNWSDLN